MTTMAPEFAANRQTAGSQQSRLPHCRFSWPIRLGLLLCLVLGHASLQAQVVASLPNIVLEPGDRVNAVVVQGDGKIIVGGSFGSVNGKPWRNLARLNADGTLDESFEPDPDGEVNALVLDTGSGYLYVGGNFARIGSVWDNARAQCAYVARVFLTGSLPPALWCPNPDGEVKAMALEPSSGDLFIGGSFTTVGSDPSPDLARLAEADGSADSRFNDLDTDGVIETLAVGGAYLYVGGSFTVIGTHTASNIARVIVSNGQPNAWAGDGTNGAVFALAPDGVEGLYVGGDFTTAGGTRNNIAWLDSGLGVPSSWNPNVNGPVKAIAPSGSSVFIGGEFTEVGGQSRVNFAEVNASNGLPESRVADASGPVDVITASGQNVFVGGRFKLFDTLYSVNFAQLNGLWGIKVGLPPHVNAILPLGNYWYVGGSFRVAGQSISNLMRLNSNNTLDTTWQPNPNGTVTALQPDLLNGGFFTGGTFSNIGGQSRSGVARIDSLTGLVDTGWALGDILDGVVRSLTWDELESLVVAGRFSIGGGENVTTIGLSDGVVESSWTPVSNSDLTPAWINSVIYDSGSLYIGGHFDEVNGGTFGHVAKLNAGTGASEPWNPNPVPDSADHEEVYSVRNVGSDIYFGEKESFDRYALSISDKTDSSTKGGYSVNGPVYSVSGAHVGGDFSLIAGQSRNGLARINQGTVDSWNPGASGGAVRFIYFVGSLYVGGDFSQIGGKNRTGLAQIADSPINYAPVANDDGYTTSEDTPLNVALPGVLSNDTDPDSDPLTAALDTNVANGTLTLNADGSFDYTPNGDFNGSDSFTYFANDGTVNSDSSATVTITVTEVNDPPVAADDSVTVAEGGSVPIDVVANDSDVDSTIDPTTVTIVTQPVNGSTSVDPKTDERTYTHNGSPTLSDSFTYTVDDDQGATSNVATVSITVTPVTAAPVANDDSATVDEAGFVLIDVLSNDTDVEGNIDPTTVAIVGTPANGGTSVDPATGEVSYTHDGSETLGDSFTYTVNDLSPGWTSNVATVSITVNAVNDPPVAVADAYATDADTQLSVSLPGVLGNDTDAEGGPLTAVLDTDMSYGTLSLNADGSFTYDPTPGFNGESSFTYYANDGTVNSAAPATVTITVGTPCGGGVDIVGGDWTMISLPCDPGIFNQVGDLYGDELGINTYGNGNEWLMYDYNPSTNSYGLLGISSQLKQDMGYWILADNSAHLDIEGNLTPVVSSTVCDDIDTNVFIEGCIEVYLTPPPPGTTKRWNLVGNPFPYPIAWKDVRILVEGEVLTATAAEGLGYGKKNIQIYENGSAYVPYDDQTPGMDGVLNAGQAFWYAATDDAVYNIRLLFPAKPHTAGAAMPGATDYRLFAGAWTVLREVTDFVVPSARAAKPPDKGKPPKDDNPGQQRREARLQGKEWYVRLIAEWPEGGLKDHGNVLGQLSDSELGFDAHDLEEMPPFSTFYLTVIFPHDDWGDKSGNYASDYHPLTMGKGRGDAWQFEVRTDQPGREITLRWEMQGEYPQAPLLINVKTGEVVEIDPTVPGSYTFVMDATTQRFEWTY